MVKIIWLRFSALRSLPCGFLGTPPALALSGAVPIGRAKVKGPAPNGRPEVTGRYVLGRFQVAL